MPAQAASILPINALLAFVPYTNVIRHYDLGCAMGRLQPILDRFPAYDLARGPLVSMIAAVNRLTFTD